MNHVDALSALKQRHYEEIDTGYEFSILDHVNNFEAHGGCVMCHKIKDLEEAVTAIERAKDLFLNTVGRVGLVAELDRALAKLKGGPPCLTP